MKFKEALLNNRGIVKPATLLLKMIKDKGINSSLSSDRKFRGIRETFLRSLLKDIGVIRRFIMRDSFFNTVYHGYLNPKISGIDELKKEFKLTRDQISTDMKDTFLLYKIAKDIQRQTVLTKLSK